MLLKKLSDKCLVNFKYRRYEFRYENSKSPSRVDLNSHIKSGLKFHLYLRGPCAKNDQFIEIVFFASFHF